MWSGSSSILELATVESIRHQMDTHDSAEGIQRLLIGGSR